MGFQCASSHVYTHAYTLPIHMSASRFEQVYTHVCMHVYAYRHVGNTLTVHLYTSTHVYRHVGHHCGSSHGWLDMAAELSSLKHFPNPGRRNTAFTRDCPHAHCCNRCDGPAVAPTQPYCYTLLSVCTHMPNR